MQHVLTIAFFYFLLELPTTCCGTITSPSDFFLVVYPSPRASSNPQFQCRSDCANPANDNAEHIGGFVAWIFSSQDNNQMVSLLTISTTGGSFTLGGNRQPSSLTWYWNEYPPKVLSRNALGVPFWQGAVGGSAINNLYNNFQFGNPSNSNAGETQLSIHYSSGVFGWNDISVSAATSGCVCRRFATPTETVTTAPSESSSPTAGLGSTTMSSSPSLLYNSSSQSSSSTQSFTLNLTRTGSLTSSMFGSATASSSPSPHMTATETPTITQSLTSTLSTSSSLSSSELRSTTMSSSQSPRRSRSDTPPLTQSATTTFTRFGSLSSSLSVTAGSTLTCTIFESATKRISLSTTFAILSQTDVRSQSNSRTLTPRSQTISNVTRTGQPKVSLSGIDSVSHDATHSQSISFWNCSAPNEMTGVMLPLQDSAIKIFAASFAAFGMLQPVMTYPTLLVPEINVLVKLPSIKLDTGPMGRFQLIAAFPLAMAFSISSPPSAARWLVANVTMDSIPSLKWTSRKSSNTADPWWAILVEAPEPPNGWLGPNSKLISVFEDHTIELTATMSCDGSAVMQAVFVVPAPGIPQREYADEVKAAGRYSQMVSAFASLSSGVTVGRMMATISLALCDADSGISGGLIDINLRLCAASDAATDSVDESSAAVVARRAVLSNLLLQCLGAVVLAMCAVVWSRVHKVAMRNAAAALCLPSTLLPLWVAQLQSTAAAVTLLLGRLGVSNCPATDTVLCVLCIIVATVPPVSIVGVWLARVHGKAPEWTCSHTAIANVEVTTSSACLSRTRWLYEKIFSRVWRWTPTTLVCSSRLEHAWTLLLEYRLLWYSAVDSAVLQVLSCVSIVSGLNGSQSICHSLAIALAVILFAQLLLLLLVKPYTTLFSHVYSVVSLTLTTLSVIAQVLYMLTLSSSASGLWLLQVSTICNFATIGVNAVKMLLDLVQFCRSVARRLGLDCNNISPAVTAPDELLRSIDVSGHTYSPTCIASDEGAAELLHVAASPPRPATPMIFERSSVQLLDDLGVLWIDHETALAGSSDIIAIGRSSDVRRGDFLSQFLMPPTEATNRNPITLCGRASVNLFLVCFFFFYAERHEAQ